MSTTSCPQSHRASTLVFRRTVQCALCIHKLSKLGSRVYLLLFNPNSTGSAKIEPPPAKIKSDFLSGRIWGKVTTIFYQTKI